MLGLRLISYDSGIPIAFCAHVGYEPAEEVRAAIIQVFSSELSTAPCSANGPLALSCHQQKLALTDTTLVPLRRPCTNPASTLWPRIPPGSLRQVLATHVHSAYPGAKAFATIHLPGPLICESVCFRCRFLLCGRKSSHPSPQNNPLPARSRGPLRPLAFFPLDFFSLLACLAGTPEGKKLLQHKRKKFLC